MEASTYNMHKEVFENFEDFPPLTGTPFWRRKMRTAFMRYDVKGDGLLSEEDFKMQALRMKEYGHLTEEQGTFLLKGRRFVWEAFFKPKDPNRVGITVDEFIESALKTFNDRSTWPLAREQLCVVFLGVDADKSGYISLKEFENFYKSYGIPIEYASETFNILDTNKDCKLSRAEFVQGYWSYYWCEDPNNKYKVFFGPLLEE